MKRITFLFLISVLISFCSIAQSPDSTQSFISPEFSKKLCSAMSEALAANDKEVSMNGMLIFNQDNAAFLLETGQSIKAVYPNLTEIEIQKKLWIQGYFALVDSCAALDGLITNMYGECPKPTETLDKILEGTNTFVAKRLTDNVNYTKLNDDYGDFLSKLVFENEASISKDYSDLDNWIVDMESYLFHKSKPYFKMILGYVVETQTI